MELSKDLIDSFVKITNDTPKVNKQIILYGTVISQNGEQFVRLDGSDQLTPFETTAVVKEGERVTLEIQNHLAIVTGNVSNPAASQSDVDDASKVATNFMGFEDGVGLIIGDLRESEDGTTLKGNIKIDADSVDIRDGEQVLATFVGGEKTVHLEDEWLQEYETDVKYGELDSENLIEIKATGVKENDIYDGDNLDVAKVRIETVEAPGTRIYETGRVNAKVQHREITMKTGELARPNLANGVYLFPDMDEFKTEHYESGGSIVYNSFVGGIPPNIAVSDDVYDDRDYGLSSIKLESGITVINSSQIRFGDPYGAVNANYGTYIPKSEFGSRIVLSTLRNKYDQDDVSGMTEQEIIDYLGYNPFAYEPSNNYGPDDPINDDGMPNGTLYFKIIE